MPYKRRTSKKSYKRKAKIPRKLVVRNAGDPLPKKQLMKFRYVEHFLLDPGTGTCSDYVFRANSMFDPNYTSAGHQPYGFDQWIGVFYNHFVVLGSKASAIFTSPSESVGAGTVLCGIELKDSTSAITGQYASQIMERPRGNFKLMLNSDTSRGAVKVNKKFSAKNFFRVKDIIGDDVYKGSASTNPSEQSYFHVWAAAQDQVTNIAAINVTLTIDYIVALLEPKDLGLS